MVETLKNTKTNWYTIKVQTNSEKKVLDLINREMRRNDIKTVKSLLIPTQKQHIVKSGKKYIRERILYSGYIFAEVTNTNDLEYILRGIDKCSGIIKNKEGNPIPVKTEEMEKILGIIKEESETGSRFMIGETVVITEGPFGGFKGTISDITGDKIKLAVPLFGNITNLNLEVSNIKKEN